MRRGDQTVRLAAEAQRLQDVPEVVAAEKSTAEDLPSSISESVEQLTLELAHGDAFRTGRLKSLRQVSPGGRVDAALVRHVVAEQLNELPGPPSQLDPPLRRVKRPPATPKEPQADEALAQLGQHRKV